MKASAGQASYEAIRNHVPTLEEDCALYGDINRLTEAAKRGEVLDAVKGR
ncbi:MAG TPA: hypothetical protein VEB03_01270 [Candidatus Nanoarchaeia archaeon]|nr:hypothetical protein [Candidatus Nanoarchaeia archaeon]